MWCFRWLYYVMLRSLDTIMLASFSQYKLGATPPSVTLRQKAIVSEKWFNVNIDDNARPSFHSLTHPKITSSPYLDLGLSLCPSASDSTRIGESRPSVLKEDKQAAVNWKIKAFDSMQFHVAICAHKHINMDANKKTNVRWSEECQGERFVARFLFRERSLKLIVLLLRRSNDWSEINCLKSILDV